MITLFTDVDGVLTDGKVFYDERGEAMKSFNVKDGQAIPQARTYGIKVIFITRSKSECIKRRADFLKVDVWVTDDKHALIRAAQELKQIGEYYYIGDDVIDIESMEHAKQKACPADAHPQVIGIMTKKDLILKSKGGDGCLREYIDHLIQSLCLKPC